MKLLQRRTVRCLLCATTGGRLWTAGHSPTPDTGSDTDYNTLFSVSQLTISVIYGMRVYLAWHHIMRHKMNSIANLTMLK